MTAIVCPRCEGEGVFVSRSGPPCEACNGTGKVTTDTCICRWGYEDVCPLDSGRKDVP